MSMDQRETKGVKVEQVKRLAQYLKPYKKQIFITVAVMLVATITGLLSPYLLRIAIDHYIPESNFRGVILISCLLLSAICINYICNRKKISRANRIGQNVLLDIRRDLFNHVQGLSFPFFDQNSPGKIIVRIVNDVNTLNDLFTNGIVNVITEISMLLVAATLMIIIHPRLALLTFTIIPFFMLFLFIMSSRAKKRWREVRSKVSHLYSYIHECICGMKVIQAYVRQAENRKIFHGVLDDIFNSWIRASRINTTFGPAVNLVSVLGSIIIYWYGAYLLRIDGVTVGVLIAFTGYLHRFWEPINVLSDFYNQLIMAMASSERIFELMDEQPQIINRPGVKDLANVRGNVEFQNVTFSYDNKKIVLKNVSFNVQAGETIALVGATGSGKSTIINLLNRFYDISEGRILIDGYDIKEVTIESLRRCIGVMLQEPFIFSGSIMDNIKYGRMDASDDEVVKVAKALNAHDFIVKMEEGYETIVNERGSRLSIGQKQLIAFARVLLANPDILILDEATASVDTHTEVLLQKAVEKLLEGRTSFVIAHRLSTIRNADRIMVIQDGKIAEIGTHDELVKKEGLYHQLYNVQYNFLKAV